MYLPGKRISVETFKDTTGWGVKSVPLEREGEKKRRQNIISFQTLDWYLVWKVQMCCDDLAIAFSEMESN